MHKIALQDDFRWEPNKRNYAPVPLEYYNEMRFLSDQEFGTLMRILLRFNLTGEVPEVEGVLCHYVDRVIGAQKRFLTGWCEISAKRSKAGKRGAELRWKKEQGASQEPSAPESMANAYKNGYTKTETKSKTEAKTEAETKSESETNISSSLTGAAGNREVSTGHGCVPAAAPERERGAVKMDPETPVAEAMVKLLHVHPSRTCLQELRTFVTRLGVDTCLFAVERAGEEGRGNWSYVRGILRDLQAKGITNRRRAESYHQRYSKVPGPNSMYQIHGQTYVSELDRQAIADIMAEED